MKKLVSKEILELHRWGSGVTYRNLVIKWIALVIADSKIAKGARPCQGEWLAPMDRLLFIVWLRGGGGESGGGCWGDHLIFRGTKRGITENFGHGGWGDCESHQMLIIRRDHFSEVTFKVGIGKISLFLVPNPLRFKWHDIHLLVKSSLGERRARVLYWKKNLNFSIKFTLKTIHSSFTYLVLSASKRFTCIKNTS